MVIEPGTNQRTLMKTNIAPNDDRLGVLLLLWSESQHFDTAGNGHIDH